LKNKSRVVFISLLVLISISSCGGGGGGGSESNTINPSNDNEFGGGGGGSESNTTNPSNDNEFVIDQDLPLDTSSSNTLIENYIISTLIIRIDNLDEIEASDDAVLAAQGQYRSGSHMASYIENVLEQIEGFANSLGSYIGTVSEAYPVSTIDTKNLIDDSHDDWIFLVEEELNTNHFSFLNESQKNYILDEISTAAQEEYSLLILNLQSDGVLN
jgi:hypothetical protein